MSEWKIRIEDDFDLDQIIESGQCFRPARREDGWIARLMEEEFGGADPFPQDGREAGIAQQYLFYYKRAVSKKPSP